ncbi:MAG: IS30 family transposase [Lachnospiraceae bacterium]|nr:IS30 family transposase [Lachnospiraceae bacterium]
MSKFLSYEDRLVIAQMLKESASFGAIGKQLGKDRTTIAKEIKKYSYDKKSGRPGYPYNPCKYRGTCKIKDLCGTSCTHKSAYKCSVCAECYVHCPDFQEDICSIKTKPPYVCNGCSTLDKCTLMKRLYEPADAHEKAHQVISESRTGILSNEDDIARINSIVSPLVRNGQSLHQIYLNNVDDLMCSEKTLYNYVDAQLFDVRNIDLPRKVKYRPRYKKAEFKVDRGCRIGRNYHDYLKYMSEHPEATTVQLDSVIGRVGGKCLLTIHFVESSLMLAFLRDANTSGSVIRIINAIDTVIGADKFDHLFPVILTDNGSEFSNPKEIEYRTSYPVHRTNVFYCDPSAPYQKGACEVNHELIRRILPKGTSFDELTQEDIILMMNHINSYKRKKLNNRSPYEVFSFYYGEDLLKKLGCLPVAPENIILKPKLLKK